MSSESIPPRQCHRSPHTLHPHPRTCQLRTERMCPDNRTNPRMAPKAWNSSDLHISVNSCNALIRVTIDQDTQLKQSVFPYRKSSHHSHQPLSEWKSWADIQLVCRHISPRDCTRRQIPSIPGNWHKVLPSIFEEFRDDTCYPHRSLRGGAEDQVRNHQHREPRIRT